MRKFLIAAVFCAGTGYTVGSVAPTVPSSDFVFAEPVAVANAAEIVEVEKDTVVLPVTSLEYDPWLKTFGTFVDDGRFYGYHAGEDIETDQIGFRGDVPVQAIADGKVSYVGWAKGYGGVVILTHAIDGEIISSLYGHIDEASVTVKTGDRVSAGDQIALLGEHLSTETDGRRMHLHFALWKGSELKFPGYVDTPEELSGWMDPSAFLTRHGALNR